MKKTRILILLFLWSGLVALHGQSALTLGAKAGVSLANQSYRFTPIDYRVETEAVAGPVLSLFVETFRGDHFSFQVDISFALKGSSTRVESVSVNHLDNDRIIVNDGELSTSTFSYLSLAPMARYRRGQGSLHPYILLGPRLDKLLYYKSDSSHSLQEQNHSILGLNCGAGLEYRLRRLGLFMEFLYQPDLSPVSNEEPLLLNNNMMSLCLGIRWFSPG